MTVRRIKWESGANFEIDKRVWLLFHYRELFTVLRMWESMYTKDIPNSRRFLICAPHLHSSLLTPN